MIENNYREYLNFSVNDFGLQPITEVYENYLDGKQVYFLDENKNPIKVKNIRKENYSGKIYDVDVENDIVLVRRNNSIPVWSGNSEGYSQDTFDLKITGGSVEFEHIIDPYNQLDYSGFESGEQSWTFGGTDSFRYNARSAWQDKTLF